MGAPPRDRKLHTAAMKRATFPRAQSGADLAPIILQGRVGRYRLEATRSPVPLRPMQGVGEDQKSREPRPCCGSRIAPREEDCPLSAKHTVRETAFLTLTGRKRVAFAAVHGPDLL